MMMKTEINNRIITELLSGQINRKEFFILSTLLFDQIKDENESDHELKQIQLKKFSFNIHEEYFQDQ